MPKKCETFAKISVIMSFGNKRVTFANKQETLAYQWIKTIIIFLSLSSCQVRSDLAHMRRKSKRSLSYRLMTASSVNFSKFNFSRTVEEPVSFKSYTKFPMVKHIFFYLRKWDQWAFVDKALRWVIKSPL